jgi:hypothetical protein
MKLSPLQKVIYVLFFLTVAFTVISLLWFWVDQPFKSIEDCRDAKLLPFEISHNDKGMDTIESVNNPPHTACIVTPAKNLSEIHSLLINAATITGILFCIVSGYAYATRKKEPGAPPAP